MPSWEWPPTPWCSPGPASSPRLLAAAHLAAAGGVDLGVAVADGRRSALLVQTGELLGFSALAALAVQRDSPGLLGAGWLAHTAWDALHFRAAGPPGCGLGIRRFASATTWPSLCRCSPAGSSWGSSARASSAGAKFEKGVLIERPDEAETKVAA